MRASVIASGDSGLALSLAFALIGAPLAAVLWWWERRRLIADPAERASLVWALYVTAMSLTVAHRGDDGAGIGARWRGSTGEWRPVRSVDGNRVAGGVGMAPAHAPQRGDRAHATRRRACRAGRCLRARGRRIQCDRRDRRADPQALLGVSVAARRSPYWIVVTCRRCCGARSARWCGGGTGSGRARGRAGRLRRGAPGRGDRRGSGRRRCSRSAASCSSLLRLLFDADPAAEIVSSLDFAIAAALIGGDRVGLSRTGARRAARRRRVAQGGSSSRRSRSSAPRAASASS